MSIEKLLLWHFLSVYCEESDFESVHGKKQKKKISAHKKKDRQNKNKRNEINKWNVGKNSLICFFLTIRL